MRTEPLTAVSVYSTNENEEFYRVGLNGVTSIEWGEIAGHMSMLDTVKVFKAEKLYSEHPFSNCLGVYFQ